MDFLGGDDEKDLAFFPAMNLTGARKMELMSRILNLLSEQFEVVPMREHAARIAASSTVTTLQPRFAHAPSPG